MSIQFHSYEASTKVGHGMRGLNQDRLPHDCMDAGGTSPRMGEGRIMQEQLSRVMQEQLPKGAVVEQARDGNLLRVLIQAPHFITGAYKIYTNVQITN